MSSEILLLLGQQASPQEALSWAAWLASGLRSGSAWCQVPETRVMMGAVLGGIGIWGMLPSRRILTRRAAGVVAAIGAGLVISLAPALGGPAETVLFWLVSAVAIVSAAATITARNPVYSAIWFALTLMATAGLFLLNGAQFLGVATVAVYAGAIVVTFLFVLMLSQTDGQEFYDRISWGNFPSLMASLAGAALLGLVAWLSCDPVGLGGGTSIPGTSPIADAGVRSPDHVAALGSHLFTDQLIAVQVAAVLLMVALVGAVAISMRGKQMLIRSSEWAAADQQEREGWEPGRPIPGRPIPRKPGGSVSGGAAS